MGVFGGLGIILCCLAAAVLALGVRRGATRGALALIGLAVLVALSGLVLSFWEDGRPRDQG